MKNRMQILEGIAKEEKYILEGRIFTQEQIKAKMAQVIWTNAALLEFNEITEYIALYKPDTSTKLVKKIFNQVAQLELFPDLDKKTNRNYRLTIFRNCCQSLPNFLST